MKNARTIRQLIAATAAVFLDFVAIAEVVINPGIGVETNVTEKLTGATDVKVYSGLVTLNPANDFTGGIFVTNSTVIVSKLANKNTASSFGKSGPIAIESGVVKYTGPATKTDRMIGCSKRLITNNCVQVWELANGVTANMLLTTNGFIKIGPGTLTLTGSSKVDLKIANMTFSDVSSRFYLPADGTAPIQGRSGFGLYEGKVVVSNAFTVTQNNNGVREVIGGWTAGTGEVEKDVELLVLKGQTEFWCSTEFGYRHGFVENTVIDKPAKAYLTISGANANFQQTGGNAFHLGGTASKPSGYSKFNSDLQIRVLNGGKWDHSNSGAGLYLYQRPGQAHKILVDAGTMIETVFDCGYGAVNDDTSATVDVTIRNGGAWKGEQFIVNTSSIANPPPVTVKVSGGSKFLVDSVQNRNNGKLTFEFDDATLGNLNFVWSLVKSKTTIGLKRRAILPASVTAVTIGKGGLTLFCQDNGGYIRNGYSRTLGQEIVIEKALTPSASLAQGEKDGGLTITAQYPTNLIEVAAANTYEGPTVLKNGTFTISGAGVVPAASEFTQEAGSTLYVDSKDITLSKATFQAMSIIKIKSERKLIITDTVDFGEGVQFQFVDADGNPLVDPVKGLEFIEVPESQKSKLSAIKVTGICSSSLYFSGSDITTKDGKATLSVDLAQRTDVENPAETTSTWKGGDADDSLETAANWDGSTVPAFDGGCLATFSEADGRAVVSGEKAFRGIKLGDNSFTFAKDNAYAFILLKAAGLQFDTPTAANTLKFEVPVESEVAQTWELPANAKVEFADRVRFAAKVKSAENCAGNIVFSGSEVRAANMRLDSDNLTVFFAGHIDNLDESISATSGADDAGTVKLNSSTKAMSDAGIQRNVLSNAVFRKAVYFGSGLSNRDLFRSLPNTTNIFKGYFQTTAPYRYLNFGANSTTIFDCTMYFGWSMGTHGTGTLIFRKPLKQGGGRFLVESACTVKLETTGNNWKERMNVKANGARVEYLVDDTFASVSASSYLDLAENNVYCTNDIFATTQHFPNIYSQGQNPVITGGYSSKIVITTGVKAGAQIYGVTNVCCRVEGGVSLEVDAAGDLVLASRAFNSCGDLIAAKGTLRLENGATWRNGTNFIAKGTGALKFTAANQVNKDFAVLHMEDGCKVEIPENVTINVHLAETNGVSLAGGKYTCKEGGAAGAVGIPQLTGKGTLEVLATQYTVSDGNEPQIKTVVISNGWMETYAAGKTVNDTAANGFPYWKCYVLGLTPNDVNSLPIIKGVQNANPNKLAFALGNVTYNASSGVAVTYTVKESTEIGGTYTGRATTNAGEVAEFDLPTGGILHYYRVWIEYSN